MIGFILTILLAASSGTTEFSAKVVKVIDGNTLEVYTSDKETVTILLNNVDCPELGQAAAEKAMEFTRKMVLKKKVNVRLDGKDRWGNKLATVVLNNGKNLNYELVKNGLAWAGLSADKKVVSLEEEAKARKLGLWEKEDPTPPWVYRRQQTMTAPKSR